MWLVPITCHFETRSASAAIFFSYSLSYIIQSVGHGIWILHMLAKHSSWPEAKTPAAGRHFAEVLMLQLQSWLNVHQELQS